MPIQTFTILNKANHAPGTYQLGSVTIPGNVLSVRWYVDSTNAQGVLQYTNPTTHINVSSTIDFNDGQGPRPDAGFTSDGGYVNPRTGLPNDPDIVAGYNGAAGATLSGTLVVQGGTVRFGFLADVTTA